LGSSKYKPTTLELARDELFSHIQRCGVLEAEEKEREEWMTDTIDYLAERYPALSPEELAKLRTIGDRYCRPAIPHGEETALDRGEEAALDGEEETALDGEEEIALDRGEEIALDREDAEV
jgi:hypothetical protein